MDAFFWIILMTFVDGLIALVGVFSLWMSEERLRKIIYLLVALSAGTLLTGGLFHLLAESLERLGKETAFLTLMFGFCLFFLIERVLHWHHCHEGKCDVHTFTYLILLGDGVHNFIDGLVIAASFIVSIPFGIITTMLIIMHEIPQELGDFGALVYGGFSRVRALAFNLVSQMTCVLGGVVGYFASGLWDFSFLLPFAAGGFLYIAASDLIPELHKETNLKKSMLSFAFFLFGMGFMIVLKFVAG